MLRGIAAVLVACVVGIPLLAGGAITEAGGSTSSSGAARGWDGSLCFVRFDPERLDEFMLNRCPASPMVGTMGALVAACETYDLNPALLVAMAGHETHFATAPGSSGTNNNNPFGLNSPGGDGNDYVTYADVKDSYEDAARTVREKHMEGIGVKTLRELSATWTWGEEHFGEVNPAWASGVENIIKEIYAFCAPPLGEIGDLRERVIAIAKGELGKPYLFEDTAYPLDPAAHNCSTLVQYVTHQAGIIAADGTSALPAPSQVQWAIFPKRGGAVRAVSYFDAAQRGIEPGDVVFFVGGLAQVGSQMPPAHVGIYVGDGVYIHAPRTGLPVMESRLSDRADLWGYGDLDCLAGGGDGP